MNSGEIKIQGEIKTDEETLKKYSRDESIFELRPQALVLPKNVEDIKQLVKWVSENKEKDSSLSITARGSGTDMTGGAIGESFILDFKNINRLIRIGGSWAEAEAGMLYKDFETALLQNNLLLPSFTETKEKDTLGGMVGNNSGGEKSLKYGQTIKYIEEVSAVLADGNEYVFRELNEGELESKMRLTSFEGELYRKMYELVKANCKIIHKARPTVSKNSSGYPLWEVWNERKFNLAKLFAGGQGTLGLVAKIKFKLIRPFRHSRLAVIYIKNIKQLSESAPYILKYNPESLEVFDSKTASLAARFLPELGKKIGGGFLGSLKLFLPEIFGSIFRKSNSFVAVAEFAGENLEDLDITLHHLSEEFLEVFDADIFLSESGEENEKYKLIRRESFKMVSSYAGKNRTAAAIIDDLIVHKAQLPEFLPKLEKILKKYGLEYSLAGHLGDSNFHVIPLVNLGDFAQRNRMFKLAEEVYELVFKLKGSNSAEHGDGFVRGPFLEQTWGKEMLELFSKTKEIFDPQNIFNPGKKIVGTREFLSAYIKKG